ncbi:STAS domain-containing protein [Pseudoalteromonas shioyasakiensis]|uniref:STAS domain-containing protein n=1 Tax=Pseudoalteromonas shioyasakiensis TaxID=1190813 RepID=UPI002117DF72|nr:STAS domain-containing protein [Pseudoalteromonas shioyasakiensis]MCQ8879866.1 STAS domain-containing protein [Pseudoalteromonas shioyasakiensis]
MLKLPEELAITKIESLHQDLLNELSTNDDVCIDISEVSRADTASIQLLCALQKHLLSVHHKIIWIGQSEPLNNAINQLGLNEYLILDNAS